MTCTVLPLPAWTAWAVYLALVAYLAAPARAVGRSPKHVNQVLNGKASTHELDYWAHVLGVRFVISLAEARPT